MDTELPFIGFNEHIASPLATTDQRSFTLIKRFFLEQQNAPLQPFSVLIGKLSGKKLPEDQASTCWQQLLKHKILLQQKLGRRVGIQTAAIDYFDYQLPIEPHYREAEQPREVPEVSISRTDTANSTPDYRLEKLKEEILRSKRYHHALSIILVDIDNFRNVNQSLGYTEGDRLLGIIVQIIRKIIRTVDFLSRISGDRFLIILPNTNLREAKELAERIRLQIFERTARLKTVPSGITATLSAGQCTTADSSIAFIRRVEHTLEEGKQKKGDAVYTIT